MATTSNPRILRHCLMAGLCSASEATNQYSGRFEVRQEMDERSILGGAMHRCPYGDPDTSATVW